MSESLQGFMARIKKQEGNTYIITGKLKQARSRFLEVCRLAPGDAEAWYKLGHLHERLGATGDAEDAYRKALSIDPKLGEAHQYLGNLLSNAIKFTKTGSVTIRAQADKAKVKVSMANRVTNIRLRSMPIPFPKKITSSIHRKRL